MHRTTSTPSTCSASIGETCCVPLGRRRCFLMFFPPESSFAWNKTGKKNPSHIPRTITLPIPDSSFLCLPKAVLFSFKFPPPSVTLPEGHGASSSLVAHAPATRRRTDQFPPSRSRPSVGSTGQRPGVATAMSTGGRDGGNEEHVISH